MDQNVDGHPVDEAAEERIVALISASQPALRGVVRAIVRRLEDVDDVVQETNLVLWRKRHEYDSTRPFLPWACQIARFQSMALLKRVGSQRSIVLADEVLERLATEAVCNAEKQESRVEALRHCLERLSVGQREILARRYSDGTSVQSIAHSQGRSADAVSMLLYRIRKSLQECIQQTIVAEAMS